MKKILLTALLGLLAGWIFSFFIPLQSAQEEVRNDQSDPLKRPHSRSSIGPAAPQARSALSLDSQRLELRQGRPINPFREILISKDLIHSLSTEELAEALLAGQIWSDSEITTALAQIAHEDPVWALSLLEKIPGHSFYKSAQSAIIKTWSKNDPEGLLKHLQQLPSGSRRANLAWKFAKSWARQDPEKALAQLAQLKSLTGIFSKDLAESLISNWAKEDYEAAEQWVLNQTSLEQKDTLYSALLIGQMKSLHGHEAIDFALAHPQHAPLQQKLMETFRTWTYGAPEDAIKRFATMPQDHHIWRNTKDFGQAVMISLLLNEKDPTSVLAWSEHFPEGKLRRRFLLGAANNASGNNSDKAEDIIAHLPESREREQATSTFVELKMRQDPVALATWLNELEPSPSRDSAVSRFSTLLAKSDPQSAREWAETIANEEARERQMKRLQERSR